MASPRTLLTSADKLRQASKLILDAIYPLDTTGQICGCCGAFRRSDLGQYDIWRSLKEMPKKLQALANTMELHDSAMGKDPNKEKK